MRRLALAYGFGEHIDLRKAGAVVVALFFVLAESLVAIAAMLGSHLHFSTDRWAYFVYVLILGIAGGLFAFAPKIAWPLLGVTCLELALGASSLILSHFRTIKALVPPDASFSYSQYQYHPLLQAVPTPEWRAESRGVAYRHNAQGLRGPDLPKDVGGNVTVINVFGGSSTYDLSVGEGKTWTEATARWLGNEFLVLNRGTPGYSSVEHVIQTAFYSDVGKLHPTCSVYYIGWNDLGNSYIPGLDSGYADFHLPYQVDGNRTRRTPALVTFSPLLLIVYRQIQRWFDTAPYAPEYYQRRPAAHHEPDPKLEHVFRTNIRSIAGMNRARGVHTLFIAQLLNRARLTATTSYGWLPFIRDIDVWPLEEHLNHVMVDEGQKAGANTLELPIESFEAPDFADQGHCSEKGAEKFANLIAPVIRETCR